MGRAMFRSGRWPTPNQVIPWLVLIVILEIVFVLVKCGVISNANLTKTKPFIDTAAALVTASVVVAAGILSYLRFFKGRVLSPKLDLQLNESSIPTDSGFLHTLEIELRNKGSVPVLEYRVGVWSTIHQGDSKGKRRRVPLLSRPRVASRSSQFVDVDESAFEQVHLDVPANAHAITYLVIVRSRPRALWYRRLTVSNAPTLR